MNFKYSRLTFCPLSCRLDDADLAETHGEIGRRVNIFRTEKGEKKKETAKQISGQCQSKWVTGWVPSFIDLLYKALEQAR